MKPSRCVFLPIVLFALATTPSAADRPPPYEQDPAAITILEKADAAIRKLPGVAFHASYFGTHTSRGRMAADVLLRRDGGADEAMGTIAYRVRSEVTATDPPYGYGTLPRRYVLLDGPDAAELVDPAARTVHVATGQGRYALNAAGVGTLIPPQYLRTDPLKMEMSDNVGALYLGTEVVDGVDSDVVWLKFPDTTGFGEQLLYFGAEDHLLRKVIFTAPRAVIRERTDTAPEATYPTVHFELTLTRLEVAGEIDESHFSVASDGYREVNFDAAPLVGNPGPAWTLQTAGGTVSSAELRGQVAYLFFWASWCPNCHLYMPEVQRVHDEFEQVRVIAINAFDRDDAMRYIRDLGYTFEVAFDGDDLLVNRLRFIGQPALVVLDRDGVIRHRELVPRLEGAGAVRDLLGKLAGEHR